MACGFVMRRAGGQPLETAAPAIIGAGALPDIVGRVGQAMAAAIHAEIYPLVEHAGNVMISKGT